MGGCMSRLKAEMVAPPARSGNWEGFAPQRPEAYVRKPHERQMQTNGAILERKETPTGIPGLTYDQAGRPVWRDPNSNTEVEVTHHEGGR